jgi:hypothetical protein
MIKNEPHKLVKNSILNIRDKAKPIAKIDKKINAYKYNRQLIYPLIVKVF